MKIKIFKMCYYYYEIKSWYILRQGIFQSVRDDLEEISVVMTILVFEFFDVVQSPLDLSKGGQVLFILKIRFHRGDLRV